MVLLKLAANMPYERVARYAKPRPKPILTNGLKRKL